MMGLVQNEVMTLDNYLENVNVAFRCIPDFDKRRDLVEHWPDIFGILLENPGFEYNGILLTGVFEEFT